MSSRYDLIVAQAMKELTEEQFRADVEKAKLEIFADLQRKSLWSRFVSRLPFVITWNSQ